MASPQLEDGYTRVANELLEALIAAPLSGQELRIALTVIRKTYGYGGKKMDRISMGQFEKLTGIPKKRCQIVMKELVEKNIIIKGGSFWKPTYGPQKNYKQWKFQTTPQEKGTLKERGKVPPCRGVEIPPCRGGTKERKKTKEKKGEGSNGTTDQKPIEIQSDSAQPRYPSVLKILHDIEGWPIDQTKDNRLVHRNKEKHNLTIDQLEQAAIDLATRFDDNPGKIGKPKANPRGRFNTFAKNRAKWDRESGVAGDDGQPSGVNAGRIMEDATSYCIRAAEGKMNFEQFGSAITERYKGQTVSPEAIREAWDLAHRGFGEGNDG